MKKYLGTIPIFDKKNKEQAESYIDAITRHHIRMNDIREIGKLAEGLRFIDLILGLCGHNESIFTGNSETYYNSGAQDVAQKLVNLILEADPEIYFKILRVRRAEEMARQNNEIKNALKIAKIPAK